MDKSHNPHVFVIAEVGVNHNGSLNLARELVHAAVSTGADAVKFQIFDAARLASAGAVKAPYQEARTLGEESQRSMLEKLQLSSEDFAELSRLCASLGTEFMATPFDEESLQILLGLSPRRLKLSSGDLTTGPLLLAAARSGLPVILSTGMSGLSEIHDAVRVMQWGISHAGSIPSGLEQIRSSPTTLADVPAGRITLLQCTTEYPCPYENAQLRSMQVLREEFGFPVGFSDHTPGFHASVAAAALGATVIEKHITMDRRLPGPDHHASLVPDEFRQMVQQIREIGAALGGKEKRLADCEVANQAVARKSLVARKAILKGETFSRENLDCKRPGTGISPLLYWDYLGRIALRDYSPDMLITE